MFFIGNIFIINFLRKYSKKEEKMTQAHLRFFTSHRYIKQYASN